jgi:hypothetical protein
MRYRTELSPPPAGEVIATAVGGVRTLRAAGAARFNQPKPKPNPPAEPSPVDGFSFAFGCVLPPPCVDRPSRCLYVRLRTFAYACGVRCQPLSRRCVRGARCLGLPVRRSSRSWALLPSLPSLRCGFPSGDVFRFCGLLKTFHESQNLPVISVLAALIRFGAGLSRLSRHLRLL